MLKNSVTKLQKSSQDKMGMIYINCYLVVLSVTTSVQQLIELLKRKLKQLEGNNWKLYAVYSMELKIAKSLSDELMHRRTDMSKYN